MQRLRSIGKIKAVKNNKHSFEVSLCTVKFKRVRERPILQLFALVFYVKKATNNAKDQSYMLYRLPQNILERLVLPLGQYEKPEIRAMAQDLSLFNADKPDSQEICFIPDKVRDRMQ